MKPVMIMVAFACLLMTMTGCAPSAKLLRVNGEDAAISGFVMPAKEPFEEENRDVRLTVVPCRPGAELVDLEAGRVDAVVSVQPLTNLLQTAASEKIVIDPAELTVTEVGRNDTVVFLNRKNSIKSLSKKQLKSILSGKIGNWRQLRGANRGIILVVNGAAVAENDAYFRDILGEQPLAAKLISVRSFDEVRQRVMETPGAIGVAPSGYIVAGVNVPRAPHASSPVIIITKGDPNPQVRQLTDILKDMALLQ